MSEENSSPKDDMSYIFNASYSDSYRSGLSVSALNNGEMQIKRSSSYVYDLDDSLEYFENAESLFDSLVVSSMPDLQSAGLEIQEEPFRRRGMSAAPDYFHGSFHTLPDSCVDLSSFMNNQIEILKNHGEMCKKIQNSESVRGLEDITEPQPTENSMPVDATNETEKNSSTPFLTMNTSTLMKAAKNVSGTFSQSSPYDIEMEVLVLPMVSDFSQTELRIPLSSLSVEKKKVLKRVNS